MRMLGNRVLVRPVPPEDQINSIVLPTQAQNQPLRGWVLKKGVGSLSKDGTLVPFDGVSVGDKVLYAKFAGQEVVWEGQPALILHETDLIAVLP